jgi:hypothetical protein
MDWSFRPRRLPAYGRIDFFRHTSSPQRRETLWRGLLTKARRSQIRINALINASACRSEGTCTPQREVGPQIHAQGRLQLRLHTRQLQLWQQLLPGALFTSSSSTHAFLLDDPKRPDSFPNRKSQLLAFSSLECKESWICNDSDLFKFSQQ